MGADQCKCILQLKHKMLNPIRPQGVQDSHRASILAEMATLKEELVADNVKPIGVKLFTNDPDLKELLM